MYDVIIVGGGSAGLTAGIYLTRAGFKTLILEKETIGGAISSTPLLENYPGFIKISGSEFADNLYEQAINSNAEIEVETALKIEPGKVITENKTYEAKAIIISTGTKYRLLGLENETNLIGHGIHFCTSCDGPYYKNKNVAVVGGGNIAITNSIYLSEICKKVYLICRGNELKGEKVLIDKLNNIPNIEVLFKTNVVKLNGEDELKSIILDNNKELEVEALFEAIGMDAQTELVKDLLNLDNNYIKSENCLTNIEGIFTAGDCRTKKIRQVTTAVNDGTIAAMEAIEYLQRR